MSQKYQAQKAEAKQTDAIITKLLPDELSIKSICLDCKNYDQKGGVCTAINPYVKTGDNHYLVLSDKASCFGFEQA